MEVHHRSHTAPKKWTHYFFDFLMLFLAVISGFIAENIREHRIEHIREKEMMRALLIDLKADIAQIDSLKIKRTLRNKDCDSLISLLSNSPGSNKESRALIYFYGRNASRRLHFRPQDGTLEQLKNSGGFRVVHNTSVLNTINLYVLGLKANLENIDVEEKELSEYTDKAAKIFDIKVFQEMMKGDAVTRPSGSPSLLSYDPLLLNELCIKLHYWKRTSVSVIKSFDKLKENAERLIGSISNEYHLK
jgi:hypothetical protein